ncbi:MAG: hypothetical protein D3923_03540 [Candidatus Electrothrix sp. AR3]|nr:hypothetical protein [Candidatus Electrothrix sp. AR3]
MQPVWARKAEPGQYWSAKTEQKEHIMRLKFFSLPAFDLEAAETKLNRFLASHRIHKIDRHFVQDGSASCWCLCVLYQEKTDQAAPEKRERVDYKELLSEDDFATPTCFQRTSSYRA